MIKDIQTVSDSYYFNNDIIVYEKLNMFYFKVVINSASCTILSHNHKIISESDIIINSIWKDVYEFVNITLKPKQELISNLYSSVIIGFLYCPVVKPLKIEYKHFYNVKNDNNRFIISNVKDYNKNDINISDFCLSVNLLNIRGVGGGPVMTTNNNFIKLINDYAHKNINKCEFIHELKNANIKSYSGNEIDDIEGIIIKNNKDIYQIILNDTSDTKIYNRSDFELLLTDFIDTWKLINDNIINDTYTNIICDIFLKYINKSNIITKISDPNNLIPPGNHYIGNISYELLNNDNIKTICELNDTYKNIFRILFNGLKHYKKKTKYSNMSNDYINSWNDIVNFVITKIKRD